MDDRKPSLSLSSPSGQADANAAPVGSVRDGSFVIYFASAEEVSEGFVALRAMGFETEVPLSDILPQSNITSDSEDR
jgi:hypothetical protein